MLIAWSMLQMKGYGQVALRAVADSLDFLVDMKVYFAVLDDSMFAVGQEIYHLMFDNTDDLLLASTDEKMLWKFIEMLCKYEKSSGIHHHQKVEYFLWWKYCSGGRKWESVENVTALGWSVKKTGGATWVNVVDFLGVLEWVVKNLHIVQSIDWHICNYESRMYCEFWYDTRMVKLIIISTFVDSINVKRWRDISRFSFIWKNKKLHLYLNWHYTQAVLRYKHQKNKIKRKSNY